MCRIAMGNGKTVGDNARHFQIQMEIPQRTVNVSEPPRPKRYSKEAKAMKAALRDIQITANSR